MTKQLKNTYRIQLSEKADKDFSKLPKSIVQMIDKAIKERLSTFPELHGKPLRYDLVGYRRLRVSNYRIIYRIKEDTVNIVAIDHRKDVYE